MTLSRVFKGKSLTVGAGVEDYSVELGHKFCELKNLFDNALFCLPPSTEPNINRSLSLKEGEPVLVVIK